MGTGPACGHHQHPLPWVSTNISTVGLGCQRWNQTPADSITVAKESLLLGSTGLAMGVTLPSPWRVTKWMQGKGESEQRV